MSERRKYDITARELYAATWIPHPAPDRFEEILAPWTARDLVLDCVTDGDDYYVVARDRAGHVNACWKILGARP